jgi:hypothetical protein
MFLVAVKAREEHSVILRRVLVLAVVSTLIGVAAPAATMTVTTDADSGPGSLREAITTANGDMASDMIQFDAPYTIVVASQLPPITTPIEIVGLGWDQTIIDGGNPTYGTSGVRLFEIEASGQLVLDGVMLQNGYDVVLGGAVHNDGGIFTFRNSRAQRNRSGYGGFLWNEGGATVEDSRLVSNEGTQDGGAVFQSNTGNTFLDLRRSELRWNETDGNGGALNVNGTSICTDSLFDTNEARSGVGAGAFYREGFHTATNCTFSANQGQTGAGLFVGSTADVALSNVTIATNNATASGGGLSNNGSVTLVNTLLAFNGPEDCSGIAVSSDGYNLEGANTCGLGEPTDLVNMSATVSIFPLEDNGGPTRTHRLGPTSSALDAADDAAAPAADQRGETRPIDGDTDGTATADIGAFELQLEPGDADGDETFGGGDLAEVLRWLFDDFEPLGFPDCDGDGVPENADLACLVPLIFES